MLSSLDIQISTPIVMNYSPYTGGRFIANCLSLSKHTLLTAPACADYLISNPTDYSYRLAKILATLPDQGNMPNWTDYELDIIQPNNLIDYEQNDAVRRVNIEKMVRSGMSYFIIAHGSVDGLRSIVNLCKNSKIVKLVNSRKFQTICLELKKSNRISSINNDITLFNGNECEEKYNILKGNDWPTWKDFDLNGCNMRQFKLEENIKQEIGQYYKWNTIDNDLFNVDIDSNIFDTDMMIEEIRKLYDKLSFDDFSPDLVRQYHDPYLKLHNISQA